MADMADTEERRWMPKQDNNLDDQNGELWNKADHFPLRYQCCICSSAFAEGDELVGLVEGKESTRLGDRTDQFFWKQQGPPKANGQVLCRQGECKICWKSRATASVHVHCLLGFIQSQSYDDKMHILWRFAQARRPHPTMPSVVLPAPESHITLNLPEQSDPEPSEVFSLFLNVASLPQELLTWVRELSPSSPAWHIAAGQALSYSLYSLPRYTEYGSLPLNRIASWERGQGFDSVVRRNEGTQGSGHVRLVMDTYGIQKVESVPYEQGYNADQRRDDVVFITVPGNDFGKCRATIADGRMRLHHPHGEYGSTRFWITDFPVWDVGSNTSSDQDDQKTDFLSVQRRDFSRISAGPLGSIPQIFNRYRSVKLKGITGLTFFYGFDGVRSPLAELVDIHSHTERAPYAAMSRDSRHSARRAPFRWVYVPIADNDQIEELAVLHLPSSMSSALRPIILIRTKLAKDIWVGWGEENTLPSPQMQIVDGIGHNVRFSKDPTGLIYHKPELGHVQRLSADKEWRGTPEVRPFANLTFKSHVQPTGMSRHKHALFSEAPLERVARVAVFWHELTHKRPSREFYCTGLLFEYEDGSERAVGECRLGVEFCQIYEKPVEMLYGRFHVEKKEWPAESSEGGKPSESGVDCVWVEFRVEGQGEMTVRHLALASKQQMTGHVGFWMTEFDSYMAFTSPTPREEDSSTEED